MSDNPYEPPKTADPPKKDARTLAQKIVSGCALVGMVLVALFICFFTICTVAVVGNALFGAE